MTDPARHSDPKQPVKIYKRAYKISTARSQFFWTSNRAKPKGFDWIYADRLVKTGKNDKAFDSDVPFQAIQVCQPCFYQPPFRIDRMFKKAFEKAIQDVWYRKMAIRTSTKPTTELVENIARHYRRLSKR